MTRSELPELDYVKLITFGVLVYFEKSHLDWTKPAPDKVLLANLGYQLLDFVHGMMVGIILVENCLHLAVHLDPHSPEYAPESHSERSISMPFWLVSVPWSLNSCLYTGCGL